MTAKIQGNQKRTGLTCYKHVEFVPIVLVNGGKKMKKIIIAIILMVGAVVCVHAGVSWKPDIFLAEPIESCSIWQQQILYEYETSKNESVKARNAYILSELWKKGLLQNKIKDFLVDKYYKLVLLQSYGNYQAPNWIVQCQQNFPFPSNWVRFTPTLYKNGLVKWAPDKPQKEHAMSQNSSIITSWTGGEFANGDVICYAIKIDERKNKEILWEKIIVTNRVVLQGLKDGRGAVKPIDSGESVNK